MVFWVAGEACLRVDCVLGQGAFATVYKATNPTTSDKMVLKVGGGGGGAPVPAGRSSSASLPPVAAGPETGQSMGVLHQHAAGRAAAARRSPPLRQHPLSSPVHRRQRPAGRPPPIRHPAGWYQPHHPPLTPVSSCCDSAPRTQ